MLPFSLQQRNHVHVQLLSKEDSISVGPGYSGALADVAALQLHSALTLKTLHLNELFSLLVGEVTKQQQRCELWSVLC